MAYDFVRTTPQFLTANSAPVSSLPITMSAWVYPTTNGVFRTALALDTLTGLNFYLIAINDFQQGAFNVNTGVGNSLFGGTAVTLNTWNHVCAVVGSTNSRIVYLNGSVVASSSASFGAASPSHLSIGTRYGNGVPGNSMSGRICDTGIWNVALTASEVATLSKGFACRYVRPQNLVFHAPLIREIIDTSRGIALTNNNAATVTNHTRIY